MTQPLGAEKREALTKGATPADAAHSLPAPMAISGAVSPMARDMAMIVPVAMPPSE